MQYSKNTLHPNRSFRLVWKHKSVNNFKFKLFSFAMFWPSVCESINLVSSYCRTALLFSIILTAGAGFISALSPNYISLLALRFLVGIGVGGTHVFSSWFLEFVPAKNRGCLDDCVFCFLDFRNHLRGFTCVGMDYDTLSSLTAPYSFSEIPFVFVKNQFEL